MWRKREVIRPKCEVTWEKCEVTWRKREVIRPKCEVIRPKCEVTWEKREVIRQKTLNNIVLLNL